MRPSTLRFRTLHGADLRRWLPELGRLRIAVFRDWPYLYEGDEAHEAKYLRGYAETPGAAVIVSFDGEQPVGAAGVGDGYKAKHRGSFPKAARIVPAAAGATWVFGKR